MKEFLFHHTKLGYLVFLLLIPVIGQSQSNILINEVDLGIPDAIELYNTGSDSVNLNNWLLKAGDNIRVQTFRLTDVIINPGQYLILIEGSEPNSDTIIYLGLSNVEITNINWSSSTNGAVELLDSNNNSIDFVMWGPYGNMTTGESNWSGPVLPVPPSDLNLGRDFYSFDSNVTADFIQQTGSLGGKNDSPPIFGSTFLSSGFVREPYDFRLPVNGPAGPFTFELVHGNLPQNLIMDSAGRINGTVNELGNFSFYIRVNDSQTPPKSALELFNLNTFNFNLTFEKNILLVNGVSWSTYNEMIRESYSQKAFWGDYQIDFWDCFDTPSAGYPGTLPAPKGHGIVPTEILGQYSTVIWVGNDYDGDLAIWQQTPMLDYVRLGGNLILLTRRGQNFINENFREYIGIEWRENQENAISNCMSVYPGLENITIFPFDASGHTLVAVFNTDITESETTLLFKETISFSAHRGLGVWKKPLAGGRYRADGGQVVFLSGRPYKMDSANLKQTITFILDNS